MPLSPPRMFLRTLPPDAGSRLPLEPLSLPIYALVVASALAIAVGVSATDFSFDASLVQPLVSLLTFIFGGMWLRRFGLAACGELVQAAALLSVISIAGALGSLLLAATARPFADDWLVAWDAALFFGFDWQASIRSIAATQGGDKLLYGASAVYSTLGWQPLALVMLLFASGRERHGWTFLSAWGLTLAVTVMIFPFFPALGAFLHHGIGVHEFPGIRVDAAWRHVKILHPVRDGTLRSLSVNVIAGVVTFPSFHAAAAVLLAWGFWPLRWCRWPFLLLNVCMFASSLVIGGHYLVDLVAGGAIAATCIVAALALSRRIVAVRRGPQVGTVSPAVPAQAPAVAG